MLTTYTPMNDNITNIDNGHGDIECWSQEWIIVLLIWLSSSGLFVLHSNFGWLLSITMFTSYMNGNVTIIGNGHGDIACLSKGPVLNLQGQFNTSLKQDMVYTCFTDGELLYLSDNISTERTNPNSNGTLCYFGGPSIVTTKNISRKASKYDDEAICIINGTSKAEINNQTAIYHENENMPICQHQKKPIKFSTNWMNFQRLQETDLVTCIVKVSIGFRIFLFVVWCLRILVYPFLISACCVKSDVERRVVIIGTAVSTIEAGALVVSAVLPYLYHNNDIELTTEYKVLIGINAVSFTISLIPLFVIAKKKCYSTVKCRSCHKKSSTRRTVTISDQLPLTSVRVEKKVKVWDLPPVTPAISREDVPETIQLLHDEHTGAVTEISIDIQNHDGGNSTIDLSQREMEDQVHNTENSTIATEPAIIERDKLSLSNTPAETEIKQMIYALWNSEKVGIGRDARGLDHKNIEIVSVRKMNTPLPEQYKTRKLELIKYASCLPGGKIAAVQDLKETTSPVCTMEELSSETSILRGSLHEGINEVLLFHGTKARNIDSIEKEGFDVNKCRSNYVGFGNYFAESPVKADQYTDIFGEERYIIVARVLLGKAVLLKGVDYMNETKRPPCPTCLDIDCKEEHQPRRRPFDSVVLARRGALFREFVVYENSLAHPEYLVTYKRV